MKIFVFNDEAYGDEFSEFADTDEGWVKAKKVCRELEKENSTPIVIRGERYKYVPPSGEDQLVPLSR